MIGPKWLYCEQCGQEFEASEVDADATLSYARGHVLSKHPEMDEPLNAITDKPPGGSSILQNPATRADLAQIIHRVREDWPVPDIRAALQSVSKSDEPDVVKILAVLHAAADPENNTPYVVEDLGDWWEQAGARVHRFEPPPKRDGLTGPPKNFRQMFNQAKEENRP